MDFDGEMESFSIAIVPGVAPPPDTREIEVPPPPPTCPTAAVTPTALPGTPPTSPAPHCLLSDPALSVPPAVCPREAIDELANALLGGLPNFSRFSDLSFSSLASA